MNKPIIAKRIYIGFKYLENRVLLDITGWRMEGLSLEDGNMIIVSEREKLEVPIRDLAFMNIEF